MRRDLIIGLIVSLAIHGGTAWLGEAFKAGPKKIKHVEEEKIIQIVMPKLDQEEPEKVETDEPPTPLDIAPPMQQDVPQLVQVDSFVQPIQPPPPEGLKPLTGAIVIPQNRNLLNGIKVFDVSMLDQIPVPVAKAMVQYPFEMRRQGFGGEVLVDFIVDASGDVHNAYAVRSTQHEFEAPAVQSVSKWKFKPGKKNGRAVPTHMQIPIVFTLNED